MQNITIERIERYYEYSKRIISDELTKSEVKNILNNTMGMNTSSSDAYINAYLAMRKGEIYKRTINECATNYYVQHIYEENGVEALKLALQSIKEHINYYSQQHKGKLRSIQNIYDEYISKS